MATVTVLQMIKDYCLPVAVLHLVEQDMVTVMVQAVHMDLLLDQVVIQRMLTFMQILLIPVVTVHIAVIRT